MDSQATEVPFQRYCGLVSRLIYSVAYYCGEVSSRCPVVNAQYTRYRISHPSQSINSLSHSGITWEQREIKAFCYLSVADFSRIICWVGFNHFSSITHHLKSWHKIEPDAKIPSQIVFQVDPVPLRCTVENIKLSMLLKAKQQEAQQQGQALQRGTELDVSRQEARKSNSGLSRNRACLSRFDLVLKEQLHYFPQKLRLTGFN